MIAIEDSTVLALTTVGLVAFVAIYVWTAVALAAVFQKSGAEGWKAWVPILNTVLLLRLGGLSGWLLLLALVPVLGWLAVWVLVIIACHRIGEAFGFGPAMTVLAALLFPVWASVIGFGASRWVGVVPAGGARRTGVDHPVEATVSPAPQAYGGAYPDHGPPPLPTAGWTPPPLPTAPMTAAAASGLPPAPPLPSSAADEDPWEGFGLRPADEATDEVTGAFTGAPAPISAVPGQGAVPGRGAVPGQGKDVPTGPMRGRASVADTAVSGSASPPVTRVPAAPVPAPSREPWAPAPSPMSDQEAFPDTSGPVSAIAGAPVAGGPRSARGSVSAQHPHPEIPDDAIEDTVIASRRRTRWSLLLPSGGTVALTADVVIVGRRPVADPDHPGAQLVAIPDGTVSKTHARLVLRDDCWHITDLDSTNGVLFATVLGTEVEATPGIETEAGDRFLLGDADVRLVRSDG